jgi:photosystem II stability/assembly factor-like uncharacterized protein
MRLDFASFRLVVMPLLLLACSAEHPDSSAGSAGSGNSEAPPNSAGSNEPSRFQPVPRAQPTEGGAWVVDPGDPMTLYALGERSMRSRDGGQSWSELNWPTGAQNLWFVGEPTSAWYLLVDTWEGANHYTVLESIDDGETWSNTGVTGLSGEFQVVPSADGLVLLDMHEGQLVRSTDKGASWSVVELPPEAELLPELIPYILRTFFMSQQATPVVYLTGSSSLAPLLVSTDAGATFAAKSVPSTSGRVSLDCQGRLYLLDDKIVYRSDDAASSWNAAFELDAKVADFRVVPGAPAACSDTIYASGEVEVGASTVLWQLGAPTPTRPAGPASASLIDLGDDRLLMSTDRLWQRSDDGGRTWWTAGVDLELGQLVISPTRVGSLFVVTGSDVFRSDDDGMTWQGQPRVGPMIADPYLDPNDIDVIYARDSNSSYSPWSYISMDGGASFERWPVPNPNHPEEQKAIASTAPGEVTVVTQNGVYATGDAGEHFTKLLSVPLPKRVWVATISSHDPPAIYAYVRGDDAAPELLVSVDGGATWASRDPGTDITSLIVDPADRQVVFALSRSPDEGVLRTLDGGLTWEPVSIDGEAHFWVQFDPQPPHSLYAVGESLHRSEDHGKTWQTVTKLPVDQREFALDPNPGRARYVLSRGGLLYKMTE